MRWLAVVAALLVSSCGAATPCGAADIPGYAFKAMTSGSATFPGVGTGGGTHPYEIREYPRTMFADATTQCAAATFSVPETYDGGDFTVAMILIPETSVATLGNGPFMSAAILCVGEGDNFHTIDIPALPSGTLVPCVDGTDNSPCITTEVIADASGCTTAERGYPAVLRVCREGGAASDTANGIAINLYGVTVR